MYRESVTYIKAGSPRQRTSGTRQRRYFNPRVQGTLKCRNICQNPIVVFRIFCRKHTKKRSGRMPIPYKNNFPLKIDDDPVQPTFPGLYSGLRNVNNKIAENTIPTMQKINEKVTEFVNPFTKSVMDQLKKASNFTKQSTCMLGIAQDYGLDIFKKVGYPGLFPNSSSTNKAFAFSSVGDILPDDPGATRGAYRHALWQADIASQYSPEAAERIGNCHERNKPFNPNQIFFDTLDEADSAVDQHNNAIGRSISAKYGKLSTKQFALKLLEFYATEGLYTAKRTPYGNYRISKEPIDRNTFRKLYLKTILLDDNGLLNKY